MRPSSCRSSPACRLPRLDENIHSPDLTECSDMVELTNRFLSQVSLSSDDETRPLQIRTGESSPINQSRRPPAGPGNDAGDGLDQLMPRECRLTRSMFSRHKDLITLSPLRASAKAYSVREKSLERREKELAEATKEAMKQVETTIRMTQTVHTKDDEIRRLKDGNHLLQQENQALRIDLSNVTLELHDAHLLIDEQRRQIASTHQRVAESRSDADKVKVEKLVLSNSLNNSSAYVDLFEDYEQLQDEMKALSRHSHQAQYMCEQLQKENYELQNRVNDLEVCLQTAQSPPPIPPPRSNKKLNDEDADHEVVEQRSKRELLLVIRRLIDEKMKWESYAVSLVRRILSKDPTILDCGISNEMYHCCPAEARWESYATTLLQEVLDKAPQLLETMQKPNITDHEKIARVRLI